MESSRPLATDDATRLAHAYASEIGARLGTRVLSIKGVVADHQGLRAPRTAADADVWVEPDGYPRFCAALVEDGWRARVGRETPSLLPEHSKTFFHSDWPCDIDVHWMFPGFFADAGQSFSALWDGRVVVPVAATSILAPSRVGSAIIGALHAQRNLNAERHVAEYEQIRRIVLEDFTDSEKAEFREIVQRGGAVWVLGELWAEAGFGAIVEDLSPEQKRAWEISRELGFEGASIGWWWQVARSPWGAKLPTLLRAVWVPRKDIPRNDPDVLPTMTETWTYRISRWKRGVQATLHYRERIRGHRSSSP